MQKNMQNMSDHETFQVYPKICKICNKYAKYVSQNLICRICTPHFADGAGGQWRLLPARCGCCASVRQGGGVGCIGIVVVIVCRGGGGVGVWRKSGPQTCAWPPWTWCWLSQLTWYPRNRQSGRFETATWRCQASFWGILPPLHPRARVLVHSCCPQNRVNACQCDLYSLSSIIIKFYTTKYLPEVHWDPLVCMTTPMKVEEYP